MMSLLPVDLPEINILPDIKLPSASSVSSCLIAGTGGILSDLASDYVNTSLGNLKKSLYGAAYEIFGVNGNKGIGQILTQMGTSCLILDKPDGDPTEQVDELLGGLPSLGDILSGATTYGENLAKRSRTPKLAKLLKISKPRVNPFAGGIL